MAKSFNISKMLVFKAYKRMKENGGTSGVDQQSIEDFEENLKDNLYKIWNRMSSGSYMPPPVLAVKIPKKTGGERILGIPTVADRIAQMVVKLCLEPVLEPHFLQDSYGYRPHKSALQALEVTRKRCRQYDWVVEYDVKGMFDNIPHHLLMKAVRTHTQCQWILLYIERWLKAPIQKDEKREKRNQGTPQGGVISPLLSNLFMHYVWDKWMQRKYPTIKWCRYADDGLAHCKTQKQANMVLHATKQRFKACGLDIHPDKTRIIYCKDWRRQGNHKLISFDFLGYTFRTRYLRNKKTGKMLLGFSPGASRNAQKAMRQKIRKLDIRNRTDLSLVAIAKVMNPILQGWINYYGQYNKNELDNVMRHFNYTLMQWAMRKYKRMARRRRRAANFLYRIREQSPHLFSHWQGGMRSVFV